MADAAEEAADPATTLVGFGSRGAGDSTATAKSSVKSLPGTASTKVRAALAEPSVEASHYAFP